MKRHAAAIVLMSIMLQACSMELSARSQFSDSSAFTFNPKYDWMIEKYASKYNVDPFLIKCIIKVESDFNPNAVSVAGAGGLMQLMQGTAWMYGVIDRTDPEQNIRAGTAHISSLLKSVHGDVALALAAYHAGLGRVRKNMAVPRIRETIDYVNLIMFYYTGEKDYIGRYNKMIGINDIYGDN